ncbi:MAG: BLUF domain-containing protein [Rhodobacteraceae bacterium]|nr:BLUF domain-containing protein [Paracoccaceae bacterium]
MTDGREPVFRLVYRSMPTVLPASVLLDIVRAAEARNSGVGASGLLTYGPSVYAQLIEGSEQAVRGLGRLIAADPRHRMLWSDLRPIPQRRIHPSLPMGYASLTALRSPLTATEVLDMATLDHVTAVLLDAVADNYPSAVLATAPVA